MDLLLYPTARGDGKARQILAKVDEAVPVGVVETKELSGKGSGVAKWEEIVKEDEKLLLCQCPRGTLPNESSMSRPARRTSRQVYVHGPYKLTISFLSTLHRI